MTDRQREISTDFGLASELFPVPKTLSRLKLHVKTHLIGEENIEEPKNEVKKCVICGNTYSNQQNLSRHIRNEHQEKKKRVHSDIGWGIYEPKIENKKAKIEEFPCDQCEYKTNRQNNLKMHKENVHAKEKKEVKRECDKCGYKSMFTSNVKRHIKTGVCFRFSAHV